MNNFEAYTKLADWSAGQALRSWPNIAWLEDDLRQQAQLILLELLNEVNIEEVKPNPAGYLALAIQRRLDRWLADWVDKGDAPEVVEVHEADLLTGKDDYTEDTDFADLLESLQLTEREFIVARGLVNGATDREIAEELGVTHITVQRTRKRVMDIIREATGEK